MWQLFTSIIESHLISNSVTINIAQCNYKYTHMSLPWTKPRVSFLPQIGQWGKISGFGLNYFLISEQVWAHITSVRQDWAYRTSSLWLQREIQLFGHYRLSATVHPWPFQVQIIWIAFNVNGIMSIFRNVSTYKTYIIDYRIYYSLSAAQNKTYYSLHSAAHNKPK